MNSHLLEAFSSLTPANQALVSAIIFELANKEQENHRLSKELLSYLSDGDEKAVSRTS